MLERSPDLSQSEARERAQVIGSLAYFIELDLSRGAESAGFAARLEFSARQPGAVTFLEAAVEQISSIVWNGHPLLQSAFDGNRIALPPLEERNSVLITGHSGYSGTGLGLHRSVDPADGRTYIYSDFEPYHANRSFPCFDQPDIKGSFQFRVRVPEDWVVVCAEPGEPEELELSDRCRWWGFPPTMPLSPYVIGLAAGPFYRVESRAGKIPMALYCARSLSQYLNADELFGITAQGLEYFERAFRIPYPFAKYDQVFCPEKPNGAMESPGCVTITDLVLGRGKVTPNFRQYRASLILHEMAHMWFGDLVTMRWWDDLWLNESFATLMAVFALDRATEFRDGWVEFATVNKQRASEQDQLRTSHPVVTEVVSAKDVVFNFDQITYEKGAASLRQLVAFVGEENFFDALHSHLTKHREANAEFADLVDALEEASGRDVHHWAKKWLETVGVNLLRCEVETAAGDGSSTVSQATLVQSARPTQPQLRPHRIRLGRFDWVGDELELVGSIDLDIEGPVTAVQELVGTRRPALLLPNHDDLTYAKIRLDAHSGLIAEHHLSALRDPLARALIWDAVWDTVRDVELAAHRYAKMVISQIASEESTTLVGVVLGNFREATRRYGAPRRAARLEAEMADVALEELQRSPSGGDLQSVWLRAFIGLATTDEQLARCQGFLEARELPAGVALDAELRWSLVHSLAARGAADETEIERALAADPSSTGMVRAEVARAARPTAAAKARAWARLAATDANAEEIIRVGAGLGGLRHEELLQPYIPGLPKLFDDTLVSRGAEFISYLGDWLPLSLAPSVELASCCRENLERQDLEPSLRRIFADLFEDTERRLRARLLDETGLDSQ